MAQRRRKGAEAIMAKSVLIVDDEPNIVLSLQFIMERAGYAVATAADGEEGLRMAVAAPPDIVLLDIMLPRRNGYDICRELRAKPEFAGTKIVMLTAKHRDAERETGLALGADEYITKPFSTRDVVKQVDALLRQSGEARRTSR